jgi:pilus assembly protein CpaC
MLNMLARLVAVMGVAVLMWGTPALAQDQRSDWLEIEVGKSIVLELPKVPRAISVSSPLVADIVQLGSPTRWQVQGAQIGTTDLVIQFVEGPPMIYEVTVHRDLSDLIRQIDVVVQGEPPRVYPLRDRIVVEGRVPDLDTLERVSLVTSVFDPEFVNLMTVAGDHQVQLEVIFAEISKTGTRSLGINVLYQPPGLGAFGLQDGITFTGDLTGSTTPTQLTFNPTGLTLFGLVGQGINVLGMINVLDEYNLAKIIAQPTLIALSGQQSEFLVGGQVPTPLVNANGNVNVRYRDFGTQLRFTPTVLANDVIDIQIGMTLSDIDPAASISLGSFSIPGFSARSLYGHVRLRSGETFAIAGLLEERVIMQRSQVPGLGQIPVIGALFRRVNHEREETEIMVYVTPRLVRPLGPGEVPPILGTTENNNPSDLALFLLGSDRRAKSRTATPTGDVGLHR